MLNANKSTSKRILTCINIINSNNNSNINLDRSDELIEWGYANRICVVKLKVCTRKNWMTKAYL